jgi:hypothetical protein
MAEIIDHDSEAWTQVSRDAGAASTRLDNEVRRRDIIRDRPPLALSVAVRALGNCVLRTAMLLARHQIRQPHDHIDDVLEFSDGSHGRVYRETVVPTAAIDDPVVLIVGFRLRWVHGWGHGLFRAESLLNTPLFVGFPGFVSKLWVAHDEHGLYRGVYQWNGAGLADAYVRALWWVLALVSERESIHYVLLPGVGRDEVLSDPTVLDVAEPDEPVAWWRLEVSGLNATERRAP